VGTLWFTASYLARLVQRRVRSLLKDEAGALSLEWIVIAVLLVAAATAAGAFFTAAISHEAGKLP
jgi:Flp pilus assembly pilin Flp